MMEIGKRKKAMAKASIAKGSGAVRINSVPLSIYQPEHQRMRIEESLSLAQDFLKKADIDVAVSGGGLSAQTDAIRTAIALALVKFSKSEGLKKKFKEYDRTLLVSDMRQKESSKPGGRGARCRRQKSYR